MDRKTLPIHLCLSRAQPSARHRGVTARTLVPLVTSPSSLGHGFKKRMLVFLLLRDYNQDNIVSATSFHTDLRFVASHRTHICIGAGGILPAVNVFCSFRHRFRKSGPPES